MPFIEDEYVQLTEAQILDQLAEFVKEVSNGRYKTGGTGVIPTILSSVAQEVAENQEPAIAEVYRNSRISTATNENLDSLLAITGKDRLSAVSATGAVRFSKSYNTDNTVNIPSGTTVQTGGTDPVKFTTQEAVVLETIEDMEAGDFSAYTGDTANFSYDTVTFYQGSQSLTHDSTAEARIYRDDVTIGPGTSFSFKYNGDIGGSEEVSVLFGGEDADNCYELRFFSGSPVIGIWKIQSGTRSTGLTANIGSASSEFDAYDNTWITVTVEWTLDQDFKVKVYDDADNLIADREGTTTFEGGELSAGGIGFSTADSDNTATAPKIDLVVNNGDEAAIKANASGTTGNVGVNTITSIPSPISGVTGITNRYATGDTSVTYASGKPFVAGEDIETDAEYRQRIQGFTSTGGDVTYDGIIGGVLDVGARSVNIESNNTATDNTGSGGLPPFSFEVIVFGGDDYDIANAIYSRIAPTMSLQSGTYGTSTSVDITAINGQTFPMQFSRPGRVQLNAVEFDIVVDESYAGDEAVYAAALGYIGGSTIDGTRVYNLLPGEDIIINDLYTAITSVDGVVGINVQGPNGGFSEVTEIRADGIEVISVDINEVAFFNRTSFDNINKTTSSE